jgi:hypothetical protein
VSKCEVLDSPNDEIGVALCERQPQQKRMLPRQQARGSRRTHRTMLGAKARAQSGTTSPVGATALVSCNALVSQLR